MLTSIHVVSTLTSGDFRGRTYDDNLIHNHNNQIYNLQVLSGADKNSLIKVDNDVWSSSLS